MQSITPPTLRTANAKPLLQVRADNCYAASFCRLPHVLHFATVAGMGLNGSLQPKRPKLHLWDLWRHVAPLCQAVAEQEQILREAEEAKQKAPAALLPRLRLYLRFSKALTAPFALWT